MIFIQSLIMNVESRMIFLRRRERYSKDSGKVSVLFAPGALFLSSVREDLFALDGELSVNVRERANEGVLVGHDQFSLPARLVVLEFALVDLARQER